MKRSKFIFEASLFFILLATSTIWSQNNSTSPYTKDFLMQEAKEIILSAGNCTLITLDNEGVPRARIMDPFSPEEDFVVWFGTNSKSRKVDQIKNDTRVSLFYFDSNTTDYVLIHGKAQLVNDPFEKDKRWKAKWNDFYPNRTEGYLLIKVSPIWMEILSNSRGIFGDSLTWEPPSLIFDLKE